MADIQTYLKSLLGLSDSDNSTAGMTNTSSDSDTFSRYLEAQGAKAAQSQGLNWEQYANSALQNAGQTNNTRSMLNALLSSSGQGSQGYQGAATTDNTSKLMKALMGG